MGSGTISISGANLLSSVVTYLEHLVACRDLLFTLADHPKQFLKRKPNDDEYDRDKLARALKWVETYRANAALDALADQKRGVVDGFLYEIPDLKKAHDVLLDVGHALRYKFDREDHRIAGQLDHLNDFDDSE